MTSRDAGLLRIAIWFGLLGGIMQVWIVLVLRYVLNRYMHVSEHMVWSSPIAAAITLAVPGSIAWIVDRRWPSPKVRHAAIALLASVAILGVVLYPRGFQMYARIIVSLGCGVVIARIISANEARFDTLVRRTLPILAGAVLLVAGACTGGGALRERQKIADLGSVPVGAPNVLLLILDTVRAMDMSLYGYERETTPNIARFAERGVVFDRAMSPAPWTLPSHASMFTGHAPRDLSADWRVPLDRTFPTIAERFTQHRYLTAGFVGNLAYTSRESGLARGFTHYESFRVTLGTVMASDMVAATLMTSPLVRRALDWHDLVERKPAAGINARAIDFLASHPGRPWFAFINYYDAHDPYLPRAPYDTMFIGRKPPSAERNFSLAHTDSITPARAQVERDVYDQSIRALDAEVGALLADMERRGLLQNTIVVITADHGEEFGEHGLLSHGSSLYLPALHVPLVIVAPGRVPRGARVSALVSLQDLATTLMDLTGARPLAGTSLRRAWQPGDTASAPVFAEVRHAPRLPAWFPASKGDMESVITPTHQLIRDGHGAEELFDLSVDGNGNARDASQVTAQRLRGLLHIKAP